MASVSQRDSIDKVHCIGYCNCSYIHVFIIIIFYRRANGVTDAARCQPHSLDWNQSNKTPLRAPDFRVKYFHLIHIKSQKETFLMYVDEKGGKNKNKI